MTTPRPLVEHRGYPDRILTDRHDFHQLLLGLEGCIELEAGGRGRRVEPGVLVPIAAGDEHHYLAPNANAALTLDLPVAWCQTLGLEALADGGPWRLPPALVAWARRLEGGTTPAVTAWLGAVMARPTVATREPRLRLLRLLPEIDADLARPWPVRELAARCHLAEAAFARQFRALTGRSPHAWLVERRLARARTLMAASAASLTEIGLACGFADAAHFSRVFRAHHGRSPREWRRGVTPGR